MGDEVEPLERPEQVRHPEDGRLERLLPVEVDDPLPPEHLPGVPDRERPVGPEHPAQELVHLDAGEGDRDLDETVATSGHRSAILRRVVVAVWAALAFAVVAVAAATAYAVARALGAWRAFRRLRRRLAGGLDAVVRSADALDRRASRAGAAAARLERARAELDESLSTARVLAAALGEARALVTRVTGLVPTK
ncbi:MAG TPA: hypothetical protein VFB42_14830 [Gaiellaceae bacterium]|nr:hypothetical protein [Gaiellaceae bacterium]